MIHSQGCQREATALCNKAIRASECEALGREAPRTGHPHSCAGRVEGLPLTGTGPKPNNSGGNQCRMK
jgi:hypothetical protein